MSLSGTNESKEIYIVTYYVDGALGDGSFFNDDEEDCVESVKSPVEHSEPSKFRKVF